MLHLSVRSRARSRCITRNYLKNYSSGSRASVTSCDEFQKRRDLRQKSRPRGLNGEGFPAREPSHNLRIYETGVGWKQGGICKSIVPIAREFCEISSLGFRGLIWFRVKLDRYRCRQEENDFCPTCNALWYRFHLLHAAIKVIIMTNYDTHNFAYVPRIFLIDDI